MTQINKTAKMRLSFGQKFARGLALFLPGIFLLGFNIGTGSITTMAKAAGLSFLSSGTARHSFSSAALQ